MALSALLFAALTAIAGEPSPALELPPGADPNDYIQTTWLPAIQAEPVELPAWRRYWRGEEVRFPDKPEWIRHVVGPRETKEWLAARYDFDTARLREWNPKNLARYRGKRYLPQGVELRLRVRRVAPARYPIEYSVEPGDSWESIAVDHRVDVYDLKAYNRASKEESVAPLRTGRLVEVWVDPALPWTVNRYPGLEIDEAWFDIPQGAMSSGHPNRGKITGEPCQLPIIPELYERRFDRIAHGSSHSIELIVRGFADFRHDTGYRGNYYVGSISRPHGRRFPPHRSHQSGRDVDIRLPMLPWFETMIDPPPEVVDWRALWGLIDAYLATGEVSMIFLNHDLQRNLYYAAMSMGVSAEELDEIITWPLRQGGKGKKIVRHSKGHDGHIHVRFKCGPEEPDCRTRLRPRYRRELAAANK